MRFVFVHGGFHAAWCWEHTIAALRELGHDGIAVDLPGHGARTDEESTLANRREAVVAALADGGADHSVLVGHSHSPFLSRPRELAELLVHATTTKPVGPLQPN